MNQASERIELPRSPGSRQHKNCLDSEERLSAIARLEILDQPIERNFKMLVELANSLLDTRVTLISIVTDDRQFFVSSDGLGEPWSSRRETPLSHSFCQHVVTLDSPLIVSDSRNHPLVCENLAITDLNVSSYLGFPLRTEDDLVLGSFCVIDTSPRKWCNDELVAVKKLAELAVSELNTRLEALRQKTEFEKRMRHAQKMEAIGQFTAGVAHDFNNVLGTIQVYNDLLQEEICNQSETMNHVKQVSKAVESASEIVQQLLTWSRPDQDEFKPIVLPDVVQEVLPLLNAVLSDNVQLEFEQKNKQECVIASKPSLIHQILTNLCSNADYAMSADGGKVKISVDEVHFDETNIRHSNMQPGRYIQLSVSDTGAGVPPELVGRLQDPYFTTKPVGQGTGLGLWTVFGIVNEHRGEIEITSELGKGSTFDIFFPSELTRLERTAPTQESTPVNHSGNTRILIVDDNEAIATGMKQQLILKGYDADCTCDAKQALALIADQPTDYELVIADQSMPHMPGDLMACEIKRVNPNIRTILCSGNLPANPVGIDYCCTKPIRITKLVDIIERVLESR